MFALFRFAEQSSIKLIILLRFAAIIIQVIIIGLALTVWHYPLAITPIAIIIIVELLVNVLSYHLFFNRKLLANSRTQVKSNHVFIQILIDTIALSLLLYFSGGATNAFVSLLLIPVALAAVTLPKRFIIIVTSTAIFAYSLLLWLLPEQSSHHVDMQQHFTGMWINFLLSALVVSVFVTGMAHAINARERTLAKIREEQLRQEKLLTLGVASVQVTHQVATPIASVQLLIDELEDEQPKNELIKEVQQQLKRCQHSLQQFRELANDVNLEQIRPRPCQQLISEITEHSQLNFPQLILRWQYQQTLTEQHQIYTDSALIPAILNLIQNAQRANPQTTKHIEITSMVNKQYWHLSIRDFGSGFDLTLLSQLGDTPVASKQGLGMAVLLSHASLERLGIKLSLTNHQQGGAVAELICPLVAKD